MAVSVWVASTTTTSITCTYDGLGAIENNRTISWYIDGTLKKTQTVSGSTLSVSYTFTGLSPGTSYEIMVNMSTPSGFSKDYFTEGTTDEITYEADSATVTSSSTQTSITMYVTGITPRSYARIVRFQIGGPSGDMWPVTLPAYSTSASYTFTGLDPNTTYDIIIGIRIAADESVRTFYKRQNVSTAAYNHVAMLSANFLWDAEESHFEIWAYVSLANAVSYDTVFKLTLDGGRALTATIPAGQTTPTNPGRGWTSSITANTTYTVSLYDTLKERELASVDITPGFNHTLSFTVEVTATRIRPTVTLTSGVTSYDVDLTFLLDYPNDTDGRPLTATIAAGQTERSRSWTTDIEPGSVHTIYLRDNMRVDSNGDNLIWHLTRRNNNAFEWSTDVSSGAVFNITAADWNEFASQLNEKEIYFADNDRTFTTATTGNAFTATMYNQVVNAINNISGTRKNGQSGGTTTMTTKSKGDNILAADIKQLAACLNE